MTWNELKDKIDKENVRLESDPPQDVVRVIHYRIIDSESGTGGNVLGNWFFSFTDIRYVAAYLYQILNLALDERFTDEQIRFMAARMISQPAEFAGYCGFNDLWFFVKTTLEVIEEIPDRESLLSLLNAVFLYASHLHTWINHYFPWVANYLFPPTGPADVEAMQSYLSGKE
ncbi:MAG: hypothetical protein EA403_10195 [Spirochaetaceae bacterium]|nr:MAG: hypothetical protein EA403_10195 [Spirochaetaceae bacterium]